MTRQDTIYLYEETQTIDENGNTIFNRTIVGTTTVTIPGAFIDSEGGYFKTQTNTRQQIVEDPLGVQFKTMTGIRVILDFNYESPNTSPTVVSTSYSDPTARIDSLIEAGYDPADLVNP